MRLDETYSHPKICGAYVFYQCLCFYADTYCDPIVREQICRLHVFAGIGTISDSMPVLYENRKLLQDSIGFCRFLYFYGPEFVFDMMDGCDVYRKAFYGLYLVIKHLIDEGKIKDERDIDEVLFGYYIAPMFNAPKRMNADMTIPFSVFFGNNQFENPSVQDAMYEVLNSNKFITMRQDDVPLAKKHYEEISINIHSHSFISPRLSGED